MILFSFPGYETIARELREAAPVQVARFAVGRYANQELHANIEATVSGEHCLILGTIPPPDEFLLSVLLLAETLKKEVVGKITAVLPYLAYSRQDKDKPGESLGGRVDGSAPEKLGNRSSTHHRCSQRTRQTVVSHSADLPFNGQLIRGSYHEAQARRCDDGGAGQRSNRPLRSCYEGGGDAGW
jgi:hypothetical protein